MPRISLSFAALVTVLASPLMAAEGDGDVPLAKQFFDKAVQRMGEGRCEMAPVGDEGVCREARELLLRAYDLYPAGLGALRNLGRVERSLGLYASAARHFRELARKAPNDPKKARQLWGPLARKEVEAIEPYVSYITIHAADGPQDALVLRLDGAKLPAQALDVKLDVDAGEHLVDAEAPGRAPFHLKVLLRQRETQTVTVRFDAASKNGDVAPPPTLFPEGGPVATTASVGEVVTPVAPAATSSGSRIAPLVVAGVGLVGVGVGLGLGMVAIEKRKEACGDGTTCEPVAFESGKTFANASTVVTVVGAAALVGGGVWYFLSAPSSSPKTTAGARITPSLSPSFWGLHASGAF